MADKRISDFPTLTDANDDDLIFVSSKEDTYNMKVQTLKDATKKVAEDAVEKAETALDNTEEQGKKLTSMGLELDNKVDGAYVEDGYLYLTSNGEVVAGPLGPFSGGGGGGGGGTGGFIIKLTNLMDSRVLTVSGGTPVYLSFAYSSADENGDDGPGVTASFSGVSFSTADGWLTDADGASILRLLPGGSMTLPFKLFESDARDPGATVEVEMATHNVRDYDTVVLSCLSGGRGLKVASQYAELQSEQSALSMQFKEDEKVRVSFVIEPRNLHRLIYVYVDGIMCGAIQYPAADNFQQSPAAGITIGAETSGIDVYRIRLYTKGLTRQEVLDNYIADRSLLSQRLELARANDIFDLAENIVISKLPLSLPYMVISCPQYKGDKKKNFKFSLKGGATYQPREDSIPAGRR